ncbi:MAG: hypothetical protein KKB31_01105 [Nanoarchaeota archaeon]|nr:hypothetical protein [Nanoarchaeota archaeon]
MKQVPETIAECESMDCRECHYDNPTTRKEPCSTLFKYRRTKMFKTKRMTVKERETDLEHLINRWVELNNKKKVISLKGKLAENRLFQYWLKKRIKCLQGDEIVMQDGFILNEHLINELESMLGYERTTDIE